MIPTVLIVMLIILAIGGVWGIVGTWYEDIEDLIVDPILRWIADQGIILLPVFLIVCTFFMSIRRALMYSPVWAGIYLLMYLGGHPVELSHQYVYFFIVCAGLLKTANVMQNDYYPNSKYWKGKRPSGYNNTTTTSSIYDGYEPDYRNFRRY